MVSLSVRASTAVGLFPSALKALRFPSNVSGNDTSAPFAVIQLANPQDQGMPFRGPDGAGWTMIRRIRTFGQTGHYGQFIYSENTGGVSFQDDHPYVVIGPYPATAPQLEATTHIYEIASNGGDFFDDEGSQSLSDGTAIAYDEWQDQAFRLKVEIDGTLTLTFWPDLSTPSLYVQRIEPSTYGASMDDVDFAITLGDVPWYLSWQHERASMDLHSTKIIAKALSDSDIVLEYADPSQLVTADAQNNILWGKYGFDSVDDLTCDFGTGRSFTRVDASNLLEVVEV